MKIVVRIMFLLGLGVMLALIVREGAQSIVSLLAQAGWLLLLLVPLRALPLLLDVLGWRALMLGHIPIRTLFLVASIREAINRLLPVANVGGEIVGIRLLAKMGTDGTLAAASVIVETLLTLVSQYLFFLLGLLCVSSFTGAIHLTEGLLLSLAGSMLVIVLFIAFLRNGSMFARVDRLARRVLSYCARGSNMPLQGALLDDAIRTLLAAYGCLARGLGWQLAGLIVGCTETWLRWLGHPVGFAAAIGLESITQAARDFAFVVPAGLGVQEAGLIGLGHLLGLGSDVAIALSLAKRMREILFGLPALCAWQWMERHNVSYRPTDAAGNSS